MNALPRRRWRTAHIAAAYILLTWYGIVLRIRPKALLARAIPSDTTQAPTGALHPELFDAMTSAVQRAAAWHPCAPACLERALASRALLAWYGHDAAVVVGVASHDGRLEAHAWVECQNHSTDAGRARFTRLLNLP